MSDETRPVDLIKRNGGDSFDYIDTSFSGDIVGMEGAGNIRAHIAGSEQIWVSMTAGDANLFDQKHVGSLLKPNQASALVIMLARCLAELKENQHEED